MSSRTGLLVLTLSESLGTLVSELDENVTPTSSVNPCFVLRWCPCLCPCFSCNSMISLVKSLSDRSRNKLQIPKSSPWNSLQSWIKWNTRNLIFETNTKIKNDTTKAEYVPGHLQSIVFPFFQKQLYSIAAVCTLDGNKQVPQGNRQQEDGKPQHAASVQIERTCPGPASLGQDSSLDQILPRDLHWQDSIQAHRLELI